MTWALSNPCEGANGVTVDTTNSAVYGDALTPQIGSGATVAYSTAQSMHGTSAISLATGASAVNANVAWTVTASPTVYFRAYIRTPSSFATAPSVVRIQGGGSQAARITWNASGNLLIRDSGNTTRATSSTAMSVSTWYRLEGFVTQGATGTAEIKIWSTPDGPLASPTETLTAASFNYGTVNLDTVTFGQVAGLSNLPTWYVDDLWATDFGYVGPSQQPNTTFILPLPQWALLVRPILPWYWSRSSLVDAPAGPPGPVPFSLVQSVPGRAAVIPAPAQFIHPPLGGAAPSGPVPFALAVPLRGFGLAAVIPKAGQFIHPPLGGAAPVVPGEPFLPGVLSGGVLYVEIAFGADLTESTGSTWTWTDVTSDVMYDTRVSITQGRGDETSQANPASCGFTLLNTTGDYTAYSPASQYYPNVRRGTPVRVRVDPGDGGGPRVRFEGYAAGFTPGWDPSANRATATVTAGGVLRRLTQGKTPLRSAIFRAGTQSPAPAFGWSLEDGSNATQLAPSVIGGPAMTIQNPDVSVGVTDSLLPGAAAVIKLAPDVVSLPGHGQVMATIPTYVNTGYIGIRVWARVSDGTGGPIVGGDGISINMSGSGTLYHGTIGIWGPGFTPGIQWSMLGTLAWAPAVTSLSIDPTDGQWHEFFVTLQQSGADVLINVYLDGQLGSSGTATSETLNPINQAWANGDMQTASGWRVSYTGLQFYTDPTAAPQYGAGGGWAGETADARLLRLCAEQAVTMTVSGTSTMTMGPQTPATFVALLRDCEAADGGLLYDGFGPGLGYICRSNRYNEAVGLTLDMATDPPQVANPFAPVDDDQRNRNDITVSRTGGSSARFIDQTGPLGTDTIGVYDSSAELNVADDTGLLDQAAWRVHLGTVEGLRYPTLRLDLLAVPALATAWLAVPLTGRVDVTNITSRALQHPPDDLSLGVEGWSETLGTFTWDVTQNCSPQTPWTVNVIEDNQYGRVETDGSTLAADITTTATSASVASSTAYIWTTTATFPADFPFDIVIGGERITVTAITGSSSPQTFTLTRSVNDVVKAHSAGDAVSLWHPAVIAL